MVPLVGRAWPAWRSEWESPSCWWFALIFSIAFGTKGIADHANALHNADEALRGATVARSQAGLAAHLTVLKTDFGFEATEGIELSVREVRLASQDMRASLDAAGTLDATVRSAGDQFIFTVDEVANAIDTGDVATAQQLAGEDLDPAFRTFVNAVVAERNEQASAVAASSALMGRVGDLARFLVAFLVPTAVIVLYRELAKRQQRQSELEVRLETEQELGKARDEFVANASHELRTPLTSIFGLAHLLEEDEKVHESDTAAEMVGMIIGETHDLSRMVDDLLTTARLDAGAMHYQFEALNMLDEVREVVDPMRCSGTNVAVEAVPALVRSDRLRLRQLIRNLVSNADKYGGPNIRLVGRVMSGWYEVRIEDDGEGIVKDLEARLFQRFLHKGDMPLVLGSVGLGLSIVRALAEGMGGAVWYERKQGWTAFVVRFPLAKEGAAQSYEDPRTRRQRLSVEARQATQPAAAAAAAAPGRAPVAPPPSPPRSASQRRFSRNPCRFPVSAPSPPVEPRHPAPRRTGKPDRAVPPIA